jgi:GTPase
MSPKAKPAAKAPAEPSAQPAREVALPEVALPVVVLAGRPNVGKSTLANLLTKGAPAMTHPTAGTTRDTRRMPGKLGDLRFVLLDTAGQELGAKGLGAQLNALAAASTAEADIVLLVLDGAVGVLPADRALVQRLRKLGKVIIPILNKADLKVAERFVDDVQTLGLGLPVMLSAAHSMGLQGLADALAPHVPEDRDVGFPSLGEDEETFAAGVMAGDVAEVALDDMDFDDAALDFGGGELAPLLEEGDPNEDDDFDPDADPNVPVKHAPRLPPSPLKLVLLGRPNTGKSTLTNALLGREAMLTGPEAGLTREAIGHPLTYLDQHLVLMDTPGLRKKPKVHEVLETLSVQQTLLALEQADAAVLLVDASGFDPGVGRWQVFDQQDAKLAGLLNSRTVPLVVALTKMDALSQADRKACVEEAQYQLGQRLHGLHKPLVVPISALKRKGLDELLAGVTTLVGRHYASFSTGKVNRALAKVLAQRSPPLSDGHSVSIKFVRQTGQAPVSLTMWGNRVHLLPAFYQQFLRNQLAEILGLQGVPLKLYYRRGANPFGDRRGPRGGSNKR